MAAGISNENTCVCVVRTDLGTAWRYFLASHCPNLGQIVGIGLSATSGSQMAILG